MANNTQESTKGAVAAYVLKCRRYAVVALGITLLCSCINTPLPDYYVLTPQQKGIQVAAELSSLALGVGPVTIPETINRPNIVTPLDSNQLEVAEYHRWSEPLIDNISRVLITNIADRLGVNKLYAYPWLSNDIDYQVKVDVLQMTGSPDTNVYLQVRWQLLSGDKPRQLLETRITEYRQPVQGDGYSAMVAAYSRAVSSLSDDISKALTEIPAVTSASG